jgi:hypothetical protein
MPRILSAPGGSVTTCLTRPRSIRSFRSSGVSSVEAGITDAPSFMAASMTSQICTQLGSIMRIRCPRSTPWRLKYVATRFDRSASSA